MTKFKIHDYYEFPIELDMNKYTSDFIDNKDDKQNNKYTLKSVVVHMGSSEGGHYYAFIKDNKTKTWYQFNDTSVTLFDIHELASETFGGKENFGGKEGGAKIDKNRSAYLLFYEKIDQSNCENFNKIQVLDKLLNKNENKNDEKDEFTLFGDNENENENNDISNENKKKKELKLKEIIKEINQQMITDSLNQKLFSNEYHLFILELYINLLNLLDYKDETLSAFFDNLCYANNEHPFQNELTLYRNIRPKGSNLSKYLKKGKIKIFNLNKDENKYTLKEKEEKIIQLFEYILKTFFNIIIHSRERKYFGCYVDLIKFLINRYEYCANYFLEEFSCYNTIIEYLINCTHYDIKKVIVSIIYCAMIKSNHEYLSKMNKEKLNNKKNNDMKTTNGNETLQENQNIDNKNTINENSSEIKNKNENEINNNNQKDDNKQKQNKNKDDKDDKGFEVIVYEKNIKDKKDQSYPINTHYLDEIYSNENEKKQQNENKIEENKKQNEKNTIESDEEMARRLQEQYNRENNNNNNNKKKKDVKEFKEGDINLLVNENISPNVLKLIYNKIYALKEIKLISYTKEVRFLCSIVLKFSLLSEETKLFLVKNINLCTLFNIKYCQECRTKKYTDEEILDIDRGYFKPSHEMLNPSPNEIIYGEKDETGTNILLNYDFMLLCSLMYYKEKSKELYEKNDEDIGFSFWNDQYMFNLIQNAKTKQDINYLSNLFKIKSLDNKVIFDNILKTLISILERIRDCEDSFYDENDIEIKLDAYKNKNINSSKSKKLILLRSNINIILKKLILETKDSLEEYKIKSCITKLLSLFNKFKKCYGISISIINILLNLFEKKDISKKYTKEINDILSWLNKFKVPPKFNEIRGIRMYREEEINYYYLSNLSKDMIKEFEQVETEKTNKKINRINNIIKGKEINLDVSDINYDLSEFNFVIGDQVTYDNNLYEITDCIDELIKIKLKDINKIERNANIFNVKNFNKKNMTIYDKEKISFWVETDDYRLRIKKLLNTELISDKN